MDPFCGSGMTGVAAREIGRIPLLVDLSPAATFIAYNLMTPIDAGEYLRSVWAVRSATAELERRLYKTHCPACGSLTTSLYTVWAYRVLCYRCGHEFQLWDVARDERPRSRDSRVRTEFACPQCGGALLKRNLQRTTREPVSVGSAHCGSGSRELTAPLSEFDLDLLRGISYDDIPGELWYPRYDFPDGVNTRQAVAAGVRSVDLAYMPRALWAMAYLWDMACRWPDEEMRRKLLFTLTSLYQRVTVFSEFRFWGGSGNIANYSVPAIMNEQNVFLAFERKARTISWYFECAPQAASTFRISTQSACHLPQIPDCSVDFAFADPPFGGNINYSEMNFLWESWLGRFTDQAEEAIINKVQAKDVSAYRQLLQRAFSEVRRVLKDEAWFVVMFHNSSRDVWRALQTALTGAGFQVCGTQTFDKRHGTFKQFVSDNAVGYDLLLHCRKTSQIQLLAHDRPDEVRARACAFVRTAIRDAPDRYVVRYLHVSRGDEVDFRRLYAEWLAATLRQDEVQLSFEDFRTIAETALREDGRAFGRDG